MPQGEPDLRISLESGWGNRRTLFRRDENAILNCANQFAILCSRDPLNLVPLFISPELLPSLAHRLLIRPRQQLNELGPMLHLGLPHRDDVKTIGLHDSRRLVTEPVVKRCLVMLENLINPELMNHPRLPFPSPGVGHMIRSTLEKSADKAHSLFIEISCNFWDFLSKNTLSAFHFDP